MKDFVKNRNRLIEIIIPKLQNFGFSQSESFDIAYEFCELNRSVITPFSNVYFDNEGVMKLYDELKGHPMLRNN